MQLEFLTIILVSSAKRIGIDLLFIILVIGRSLIYNEKSRGPKIDPWGTPLTILPQLE
jgi:hypothetical protein